MSEGVRVIDINRREAGFVTRNTSQCPARRPTHSASMGAKRRRRLLSPPVGGQGKREAKYLIPHRPRSVAGSKIAVRSLWG